MENRKEKKTYWPHAIIIGIILVIIACIWTVIVAIDNPVEMDGYYMENYHEVDRNIEAIKAEQEKFFKKYETKFDIEKIVLNVPTTINLTIKDLQTNQFLNDANVSFLITRPDTTKFDKTYKAQKASNGKFVFSGIVADKPGRWQIKAKIIKDNFTGFYEKEINADNFKVNYKIDNLTLAKPINVELNIDDIILKTPMQKGEVSLIVKNENGKKEFSAVKKDNKYTFKPITLEKAGKWDFITKIKIGKYQEYHSKKVNITN